MRYAVIRHRELRDLVAHVNAALRERWTALGGLASGPDGYAQAMVHGEDRLLPISGADEDYEPTPAAASEA